MYLNVNPSSLLRGRYHTLIPDPTSSKGCEGRDGMVARVARRIGGLKGRLSLRAVRQGERERDIDVHSGWIRLGVPIQVRPSRASMHRHTPHASFSPTPSLPQCLCIRPALSAALLAAPSNALTHTHTPRIAHHRLPAGMAAHAEGQRVVEDA